MTSGVRLRCPERRPPPLARTSLNSTVGSGTPLSSMRAALFGDEQPGDLALHLRRGQFCSRPPAPAPRRNVGGVTEDFAGSIHHHRTGFEANAGGKCRLARTGILAVQLGERALDRQSGAHRAFGIVLLRHRITEQDISPSPNFLAT